MRRWRVPVGFRAIEDASRSEAGFDVISICSPTSSHEHDVIAALRLRPKLIFCEKPVSTSAGAAEQMIRACRDAGVQLAVNYTRRWDPSIVDLRKAIEEDRWGRLRSVVGYYNKGLLNNGSHLLDLLLFLFDDVAIKAVGAPIEDFVPSDATVPFWLETAHHVPIQIACGHAEDFAFFELQLLFANAVITMEESGMSWRERRPVDSALFRGYRVVDKGLIRPGGYPQAMLQSVQNIFDAIEHGSPLASTGETALEAQRLCEKIRQR